MQGRQRGSGVGRRVTKPSALLLRKREKGEEAQRRASAAMYFDRPASPNPNPARSQSRHMRPSPLVRLEKNPRDRQRGKREPEQQRPVGHDPASG